MLIEMPMFVVKSARVHSLLITALYLCDRCTPTNHGKRGLLYLTLIYRQALYCILNNHSLKLTCLLFSEENNYLQNEPKHQRVVLFKLKSYNIGGITQMGKIYCKAIHPRPLPPNLKVLAALTSRSDTP